jgi:hypothetical protein
MEKMLHPYILAILLQFKSTPSSLISDIVPFFVFLVLLFLLFHFISNSSVIWITGSHQQLKDLKLSSQEFYKTVEMEIIERQIPNISLSRVTHRQSSIFTANREYLRVARNEYIFDICAAPFGTGFFFSWWLGYRNRSILAKVPFINTMFGVNPKKKTLYQTDTENMFRSSIHSCFADSIAKVTTAKGIRGFSELNSEVQNN